MSLTDVYRNGRWEKDPALAWCGLCKHRRDADKCDGCSGAVDSLNLRYTAPPTKFKAGNLWGFEKKGEKKMIITIIGSYSKSKEMIECKEFWERFGHKVNCPYDKDREDLTLIQKQSEWIEKIEEADLVVAIPKEIEQAKDTKTKFIHTFGESTSYEIAIATRFNKEIIIW